MLYRLWRVSLLSRSNWQDRKGAPGPQRSHVTRNKTFIANFACFNVVHSNDAIAHKVA